MKLHTHTPKTYQSKLLNILTTAATAATLTIGLGTNTARAGDRQKFTDYARVVHVEPAYRYTTVKVPQRVCTPQYNNHSNSRANNNHGRLNAHNRGHQSSYRTDSTGAVFIGGVIGGAIGHEVSRSMNGRGSTGATIAGVIIGSTLANSASQNNRRGNYGNNRPYVTSTQQPNSRSRSHRQRQHQRQHQQQHQNHNQQRGHRNQQQNSGHHNRQQHCTTTTQTRRERHNDGYHVTYVYKGRSFSTRTHQHPGNRIAVRVAISTH